MSRASNASRASRGLMATDDDDDDDDEPVIWSPSHGPDAAATTTSSQGSVGVEEWYERWDEDGGYMYYWSAATGSLTPLTLRILTSHLTHTTTARRGSVVGSPGVGRRDRPADRLFVLHPTFTSRRHTHHQHVGDTVSLRQAVSIE